MNNFKLVASPVFSADVPIPVPGGKVAKIKFTFKHRTKEELNGFLSRLHEKSLSDADMVMELATGWDLADEFTKENIETLNQNYFGALSSVINTYLNELTQAKQGN